jgi:hypothetical protein
LGLARSSIPATETWREVVEERAAIIEYDGSARRPWAEVLARLEPAKPPHDVPLARWEQFIDDCGRFHDQGWANRAEAFGWEPLDLFGCDRERPLARYDNMGLLWIIQGRKLSGTHGRDRHDRHANWKPTDLPAPAQ